MTPDALSLLACSVCWGSDGSTLDPANAAILFMLAVLGTVLGGFLCFIFYLAKRSKQFAGEDLAPAVARPAPSRQPAALTR